MGPGVSVYWSSEPIPISGMTADRQKEIEETRSVGSRKQAPERGKEKMGRGCTCH